MNLKNNRQALLNDVFSDALNRPATLEAVRRAARRRRWSCYARATGCCLVALTVLGVTLHQKQHVMRASSPVVRPSAHLVSTAKHPGVGVQTKAVAGVYVTTPSAIALAVVTTANTPAVHRIDDLELLELAPGAVLVRDNSETALLISPEGLRGDDAQWEMLKR